MSNLIELNNTLSTKQKILKWFGWGCTTVAMTAQGFLGLMLMDFYVFKGLPSYLRLPLDLLFFIAAEESKRRIVINHAEENFIKLAEINWETLTKTNDQSLKNFFYHALFNIPLTLGGVYAFTGITGMSLDGQSGGAALLRDYGYNTFDKIADVMDTRAFQIPFMLAATFANFVFFPQINRLAFGNIKNALCSPFESQHYRCAREKVTNYFEKRRMRLILSYDNKLELDTQSLENRLHETHQIIIATYALGNNPDDIIYAQLDQLPYFNGYKKPKKDLSRTALGFLALLGFGVGVIGFSNFYGLCGEPVLIKIIQTFTQLNPNEHLHLSPVFGTLGYASMLSIAAGLIPYLAYEIPRFRPWADKHAHAKVSSNAGMTLNAIKASLICLLGSTPNMYQSKNLQNQATWLVVFAGLASIFMEFMAARQMSSPIGHNRPNEAEAMEKIDWDLINLQNNPEAIKNVVHNRAFFKSRFQPWVYRFFGLNKTNPEQPVPESTEHLHAGI